MSVITAEQVRSHFEDQAKRFSEAGLSELAARDYQTVIEIDEIIASLREEAAQDAKIEA